MIEQAVNPNSTQQTEPLKTLFKISPEKNALSDWQSAVILVVQNFLEQIKEQVIQKRELTLSSVMISYVPESESVTNIENAAQILKHSLSELGISVKLIPLTSAENLKAQLQQHDVLMVLCTPAYADKIAEELQIRQIIDDFGKRKNDSLHTLLCAGGFGDTALKVVDGHYLIRSYQGALKTEASLTSLQTFIDVVLSVSGNQGLGLLPDMLDLEKMERAKAYKGYKKLFNQLSKTLQDLTNHYRLSQHVEHKIAQNALREYSTPNHTLKPLLSTIFNKKTVKTCLFLCPTKADTVLTGLGLEQALLAQGKLVLSVDCQEYTAKSAHDSVRLVLQKLNFKRPEIEALKQTDVVVIFKNYEQLGAYDNLYVKNQLRQWPNVKVLVTCHAEHFQHRDYQSCFLSDPANPQMDSLSVHQIPHFAPIEAETQVNNLKNSQFIEITKQDAVLHPKPQAIQLEVTRFLKDLRTNLVEQGLLKPILSENPQAFISYAWESDKAALTRQQKHLSRIARDLSTLGIPAWLDIERMTGNIDEQMAGNIQGSRYVLVIGTPRYTQRAGQPTNVQKEYQAILARQSQGTLTVFPLKFADENPFPIELMEHPNGLDFRQIDDEAVYIQQLTALIPQLVTIDAIQYQEHLNSLNKALQLLPASHLITDKNQDEIQSYDIDNRLKAYVKPHALFKAEDPLDTRFDLPKHFNEHLAKNNTKAYIILGRSGSGKSLFTLYTFKQLLQQWHQWRTAEIEKTRPEWLPIYIPLKSYAQDKADQAITLTLQQAYQLDAHDIENLRQGLGVGQKVLFILDGYDELGKGNRPNYTEQLKDWPHAKLLISGRPEHFDSDAQHKEAFALNQDYSSFKVIYVSPFSPEEVKEYIVAYDSNPDTYAKIESIPGLMPLLDNPFLLNLVLQALPRLLETHKDSQQAIKRADIYQAFIDTLFNKEAYKQQEIHSQNVELTAYHQFAENLAFTLFSEKTISITSDKATLWEEFSQAQAYIREACPLKRTGEEYSYIHKSAYEYFVAVRLWNALTEDTDTLVRFWNTRPLTEERAVIDFLVEFYQTNRPSGAFFQGEKPYLQARKKLFQLIEDSKQQPTVAQAAANAITVLNSANVPFFGRDFCNIQVPGADLNNSICDYTNFSNADLSNVQLQAASLGNVNFQGAQMQGVNFGELPSLLLKDSANSCCYSKDGRLLAVAAGNAIQIYNPYTRSLLLTLEGHSDSVWSVSFSPNGEQLASGSSDKTIRLWDVESGKCQKILGGHSDSVWSVGFSPNGEQLASGSSDKTIRLWDVQQGVLQKSLEGHSDNVYSVGFSPNGEQLASGSKDKTIRLWHVESGELQKTLEGHTGYVNSVSFSPNGAQLASGSGSYGDNDNTIRLWHVESGELQKTLEGHNSSILSVRFSPDGELLASGGCDETIRLWHVETGTLQKILGGHSSPVNSVTFSPNGEQLASGSGDNTIRLWNVQQGALQKSLDGRQGHKSTVLSVSFSPKGELLASGGCDKTIHLWDVQQGALQKSLEGHSDNVYSVSFSSNGELLASGCKDGSIRLWHVESGDLKKTLEGHKGDVNSVRFSPDGKLLASGGLDNTIRLWNVERGELHKTLEGHSDWIRSVIFSPNGEQLATGSDDSSIRLWNVERGELQKSLEGHRGSVYSVTFSPDGKLLASGNSNKTIRLWNVERGELQKTLEGHGSYIWSVLFSPNGEQLISGSSDNTIRLWSHDNQINSLNTFSDIYSLAWRPSLTNGETYLATAHNDASVRYWCVTQTQNVLCFELLWSTKRPSKLNAQDANIEGAQGLSLLNSQLLAQRGAKGKPNMVKSLTSATSQGDSNAQAELGKLYLEGKEVFQDLGLAVTYLTKAVEQKHPTAAFYLGKCYQKGEGVQQDLENAMKLFMFAAESGSIEAQRTLNNCYRIGHGIPKDLGLAFKWLKKVADQNDAEAQFGLGECYRVGEGVEQNYKEALRYYSNAAKQGHSLANLALQIIPSNFPESKRETYYLAEHGDSEAQNDLALFYYQGYDVEFTKNLNKAIAWWTKAAEKGNAKAQNSLGECYQKGEGVSQDLETALEWYIKAAEKGNINAQAKLDILNDNKQSSQEKTELKAVNTVLQSLTEQPLLTQTMEIESIQEKIQEVEIPSELPTVSSIAGLSSVGFFAQNQHTLIDTRTKIEAKKIEPGLAQP